MLAIIAVRGELREVVAVTTFGRIGNEMLYIECPWCGPRDEHEFSCGGEADIARPLAPHELSDEQWADYLFMRTNPKGLHRERWVHAHGCRRWFNVCRDTVTHQITAVYKVGEGPSAKSGRGGKSR